MTLKRFDENVLREATTSCCFSFIYAEFKKIIFPTKVANFFQLN